MNDKKNNLPSECCREDLRFNNKKGIFRGVLYGLLPHTFCILFAILSILGATGGSIVFGSFFKIKNLSLIMVLISIIFAIFSAILYLRRIGKLSLLGIKEKQRYLTILFGTTIIINLLLVYIIFPSVGRVGNQTNVSAEMDGNVQIIHMDQIGLGYVPNQFNIKENIPVKWIIASKSPYACSASIYSKELGISQNLSSGENVVKFTPKKSGVYTFSCAMGMYSGKFIVEK